MRSQLAHHGFDFSREHPAKSVDDVRTNRSQRAAALFGFRPPVAGAIWIGARVGPKDDAGMLDSADLALADHLSHQQTARQESEFVVYERQHTLVAGALSHAPRFRGIHRHWFLAQHMLAAIQGRERHFAVCYYGCDDADQIDIVALDHATPVFGHVRNAEFTRDLLSVFTARAGNRYQGGVAAMGKTGNLR